MIDKFRALKHTLTFLAEAAKKVEDACLEFGQAKATLQLEIYKLIKQDISPEEIAQFMSEQEINKEKVDKKTSRFFVSKEENTDE